MILHDVMSRCQATVALTSRAPVCPVSKATVLHVQVDDE